MNALHAEHRMNGLSANALINLQVAQIYELSADEKTPIDFSKAKFFQTAKYGLFVEICRNKIVYTIRVNTHGYSEDDIIEQDTCLESISDSWLIYANG